MNKEKLIQLRRRVNELFFKKTFPKGRLLKRKRSLGSLLGIGQNLPIKISPEI